MARAAQISAAPLRVSIVLFGLETMLRVEYPRKEAHRIYIEGNGSDPLGNEGSRAEDSSFPGCLQPEFRELSNLPSHDRLQECRKQPVSVLPGRHPEGMELRFRGTREWFPVQRNLLPGCG